MSSAIQKCRHPECPVTIRMLVYRKSGKRAPIEAKPSPDGNIHIDVEQGTYIILSGEELQRARDRGIQLHLNHFVTCEYARQFAAKPEPKEVTTTNEQVVPEEQETTPQIGKLLFDEGDVYEHAAEAD